MRVRGPDPLATQLGQHGCRRRRGAWHPSSAGHRPTSPQGCPAADLQGRVPVQQHVKTCRENDCSSPFSPTKGHCVHIEVFHPRTLHEKCSLSKHDKQAFPVLMCFLGRSFSRNTCQGNLHVFSVSRNAFFCPLKAPAFLALACSLLTAVLSITKNNVCFLNCFLAVFTESGRRGPCVYGS